MPHMACAHFLNSLVIGKHTSFGNPLKLKFSIFLAYLEVTSKQDACKQGLSF